MSTYINSPILPGSSKLRHCFPKIQALQKKFSTNLIFLYTCLSCSSLWWQSLSCRNLTMDTATIWLSLQMWFFAVACSQFQQSIFWASYSNASHSLWRIYFLNVRNIHHRWSLFSCPILCIKRRNVAISFTLCYNHLSISNFDKLHAHKDCLSWKLIAP